MYFSSAETTVIVQQAETDWITPVATLIAVIVGGLVTWLVQTSIHRRHENGEAKAGARVIQMELGAAGSRVKDAIEERRWFPFNRVALISWDEFQGILGRKLSDKNWDEVAQSAIELRELDDGMTKALGPGGVKAGSPYIELTDGQLAGLHAVWVNITGAYNSLNEISEREPIVGLIHESEPSSSDLAARGAEGGIAAW